MKNIYNVDPGEVFGLSDLGWVVGQLHLLCTLDPWQYLHSIRRKPVGTPVPGPFGGSSLNTMCAAFSPPQRHFAPPRIQRENSRQNMISAAQMLYLAGERADPDTIHWQRTF